MAGMGGASFSPIKEKQRSENSGMKKNAVITGASSGMGREFALAADRDFALDEIWVIARREDRLKELQGVCKTPVRPLAWDLTDNDSYERYRELLAAERPEIKLLINAAGYGLFGTFEKMELQEQLGMIDLNEKALTAMCRISLPYMGSGDAIVNLGSNSSWQPVPYLTVYGATKSYVLSFSRALGRELKPRGVFVMCVCPNWVKTEFMDRAVRDDTIRYYNHWYTAEAVVRQAMKDLQKRKTVSILGAPIRRQVRLVKHLPVDWVMHIWCKQQKKP